MTAGRKKKRAPADVGVAEGQGVEREGATANQSTILRAEENVLLDMKSGERALFEMQSDE